MRSVVWLLSVSILFMLVVAGLNISNQGINDLTLSNPGYVIAVHVEQEEVYVEALGSRYLCSSSLVQNGRQHLGQLGTGIKSRAELLLREGQADLARAAQWLQDQVGEKVRQWVPLW